MKRRRKRSPFTGHDIADIRTALGLTLREMGDLLSVTAGTICKYERRGRRRARVASKPLVLLEALMLYAFGPPESVHSAELTERRAARVGQVLSDLGPLGGLALVTGHAALRAGGARC